MPQEEILLVSQEEISSWTFLLVSQEEFSSKRILLVSQEEVICPYMCEGHTLNIRSPHRARVPFNVLVLA